MCVSAAIIAGVSLAATVAGTVASIDNANYQAKMAEFQLEEQRKALRSEREGVALQAMEAQIARIRDFEAQRAANLAALAGSGVGQNMSYLQGVEKAEERALRFDLTNIRLGLAGENSRVAAQIRGTAYASKINSANRKSAIIGSLINGVGQAASIASAYNNVKTPAAGTEIVGGSTGGARGSWTD